MLIFKVTCLIVGGDICRLFLGDSNKLQSYVLQRTETEINL